MKNLIPLIAAGLLIASCQSQQQQPNNNNNNNSNTLNCNNDTQAPVVDIQGNTTVGPPGTVIQFTTTATDDYNVKLVEIYGKITYDDGSSVLQTQDIPNIYVDSTTQGTTVNGTCSYTVPATVGGHALGSSQDDFIEFWAHVEDCWGDMTNNYTFNVTP